MSEIVIAHKDRLVRFGYEWFEKFCRDHGTTLTVMNAESLSLEEEMRQDLLTIIHCFSSRWVAPLQKKIVELVKAHEDDQTD